MGRPILSGPPRRARGPPADPPGTAGTLCGTAPPRPPCEGQERGPFTPQPPRQLLGSWAPGSAGKKPGEGQSPNFFIQTNGLQESPEAAGKESLELRDWE